jgi:hypothetical protein
MMMVLQWRQPAPAIITAWRGPDDQMAPAVSVAPNLPIPTLIGPPGIQGPAGPQGPIADIIDGGTFT